MSTYAIASAIEKFANNFKEVISEKNKIEKEKLAFEKEKFEFEKKKEECEHHDEECNHDWEMTGSSIDSFGVVHYLTCSKCGKTTSSSLSV